MKFRKLISMLLVVVLAIVWCGTTAFAATTTTTTTQTDTKRYIIKFKTSSTDGSQFVSKYNGDFKRQFKNLNVAVADMSTQNINNLKKDSNVAYVEEDSVVKISATTTTKSTTYTNWGVSDINASAAWQAGLTGKGVKIAIIDTGAGSHSDLAIAGGTNVISGSGTTSYTDDNGHGTHVAGIIAGQGLNGGVTGVAPGASIYAVKALNSSGSGYTSDIISGIDWAINNGMNIITMSLGSSTSVTALQDAVNTAYNDGLLIVAAAGNDGNSAGTGTNIEYPANYTSVIAVAAVDSTNTRAYFSSTGSKLEVSAPGVNIISTYLNNGYAQMSGTSMAAPFVAGDLALLKQKYPTYTNVQLRALLDSTVTDLGVTGRDTLYGYGLIVAPAGSTTGGTTTTSVATPTASVSAGTYTSSQTVTLGDTTSGVSIYYTLDGATPTSKSILYSTPIVISSSATLKAVAINSSGTSSSVLSVTYTITTQTVTIPVPTASVVSGTYKAPLIVTLSDTYTKPLKGYYTLDGSTPTTKSTLYSGYIKITSSCTLKAIAVDNSGNTSGVLSVTYTIVTPPTSPTISAAVGTSSKTLIITIKDSTSGVSIYYTTNKSTPTAKSTLYSGPITIKSSTVIYAIAIDSSGVSSGVSGASFVIR